MVTMKDGTLRYAIHQPFQRPSRSPAASVMRIETKGDIPFQTFAIARIPPQSPAIDPTERSICPSTITLSMPMARIAVKTDCRKRFDMLRGSR